MKIMVFLGSLNALFGVALGAFGAHVMKSRLEPELLAVWQTGVLYHLVHALGLVMIGILAGQFPAAGGIRVAGWFMFSGSVLFSGSLYLLAGTGHRWLGAITPFGGLCFLAGWLTLAICALRRF